MCIGVPLQVITGDDQSAECAAGGRTERLNMMLVGAQPPGTWVLAFNGSALRVMTAEDAAQTRSALAALDAALNGGSGADLDLFFADLAAREPELPPHLRPTPKDPTP